MRYSYNKYKVSDKSERTLDGITFSSKKEKKRYIELKLLKKLKVIDKLELQPKFKLQDKFEQNGVKYRAIKYIADFKYYDNKLNKIVIEDVKGMKTEVYKLKKKLFLYQYPEYVFIET